MRRGVLVVWVKLLELPAFAFRGQCESSAQQAPIARKPHELCSFERLLAGGVSVSEVLSPPGVNYPVGVTTLSIQI